MALSVSELEEAIIALRYAADGGVFPTGDRLFVEGVKPLEAELRLRRRIDELRRNCKICNRLLDDADSHLADCLDGLRK